MNNSNSCCLDLMIWSLIGFKNGANDWIKSFVDKVRFQSKYSRSSRSIVLTSFKCSNPSVYWAQCLFNGEESFRVFAERIKQPRNILCLVVSIPYTLAGIIDLSFVRKTVVAINVGVCTFEYLTSFLMNNSNFGAGIATSIML